MSIKIVVPSLGESIVEATVAHWYKQEGEQVSSGEKLVELETDKVNLDVGAEHAGVLQKIDHHEGEDVKVGDILGVIEENAQPSQQASKAPTQPAENPERTRKASEPEQESTKTPVNGSEKERVTPVARRMAEDLGINPMEIAASHPGARVTKQDVKQAAVQQTRPVTQSEPEQQMRAATEDLIKPVEEPIVPVSAPSPLIHTELEEKVPLSRRRRTIAERLVEAQHTAAMLTTFNDVDMSAINDIRKRRKEEFKEKFGVSLGLSSFFVKASINSLKTFPMVNSELKDDFLIYKHYYDIGIAIGSEEGLVVPVIRNADRLTFGEIERTIRNFVTKTNDGTLSIEDLRGGTFTITNGGVFGSLLSTPILNAPQVAILGLHRIEDRPIAVDGQVVVRPMMYLALSYDHRVIDGREAVQFLRRIKELIENPDMLLLDL